MPACVKIVGKIHELPGTSLIFALVDSGRPYFRFSADEMPSPRTISSGSIVSVCVVPG